MKNWLPGIISIDIDEGESDLLTLKIVCKYLVTPIDDISVQSIVQALISFPIIIALTL